MRVLYFREKPNTYPRAIAAPGDRGSAHAIKNEVDTPLPIVAGKEMTCPKQSQTTLNSQEQDLDTVDHDQSCETGNGQLQGPTVFND